MTRGRAALSAESTLPAPAEDTTTATPSSRSFIGTKPVRCVLVASTCSFSFPALKQGAGRPWNGLRRRVLSAP